MKKIGILSGSFDPVHDGHIAFAEEAIELCGLDRVYFLPEPRPRRKQGVKSFEHRVAMLQLALKTKPKLGTILLQQARFNVSETLPKLQARFKDAELYMLVGEDVVRRMVNWPHVQELVKSMHFIIGIRKLSEAELVKHINTIEKTRGLSFNYTIFTADSNTASSTGIRSELRRGQLPSGVDANVKNYIVRHKLYLPSAV